MDGEFGCSGSKRCSIAAFVRNNQLSPQEMRVVEGALRELSNGEIAEELGCSSSTVRTYWTRIFQKVGCSREHHVLARIARFAACRPCDGIDCPQSFKTEPVSTEGSQVGNSSAQCSRARGLIV